MIDHSLLHPTMTDADISKAARSRENMMSRPYASTLCSDDVQASPDWLDVGVCAVIGFHTATAPLPSR